MALIDEAEAVAPAVFLKPGLAAAAARAAAALPNIGTRVTAGTAGRDTIGTAGKLRFWIRSEKEKPEWWVRIVRAVGQWDARACNVLDLADGGRTPAGGSMPNTWVLSLDTELSKRCVSMTVKHPMRVSN